MTIIDKRTNNKNKSVTNRQRFIKRYKQKIKQSVDEISKDKGITDILKDRKVKVKDDFISEPSFEFDWEKGKRDVVMPGNKHFKKGDYIPNERDEGEGGGGSDGGTGELFDEFVFTLTKEEFLELYFSGVHLPNFIKKQLDKSVKHKWTRAGYIKEGTPARIDLLKTLKQAMARRIALGPAARYLEDIDMRYKHFVKLKLPTRRAVMICLMDVSASMGKNEKEIAKKFFILLYLFLHKNYADVELVFIRHTEVAKECTEEEFFNSRESGGTVVSAGLGLVHDIITKRYDLTSTNIYVSQVSDGDNWPGDNNDTVDIIHQILPLVQYFTYVQTDRNGLYGVMNKERKGHNTLAHLYGPLMHQYKNFVGAYAFSTSHVYEILRLLFKKGE